MFCGVGMEKKNSANTLIEQYRKVDAEIKKSELKRIHVLHHDLAQYSKKSD
jgi:hypothetical protein